jgi:hypothetical protein
LYKHRLLTSEPGYASFVGCHIRQPTCYTKSHTFAETIKQLGKQFNMHKIHYAKNTPLKRSLTITSGNYCNTLNNKFNLHHSTEFTHLWRAIRQHPRRSIYRKNHNKSNLHHITEFTHLWSSARNSSALLLAAAPGTKGTGGSNRGRVEVTTGGGAACAEPNGACKLTIEDPRRDPRRGEAAQVVAEPTRVGPHATGTSAEE